MSNRNIRNKLRKGFVLFTGLAIVKDLTQLHQGEIFVDSEYGKGSTFSVLLPRLIKTLAESINLNPMTNRKKVLD